MDFSIECDEVLKQEQTIQKLGANVLMIVAGSVGKTPLEVVKRTSVPMIAGTIFMFVLSMIFYM